MIDSSLADILTFDTSGIELYVTENNPKTLNSLIKKLKAYYKDNPDVDSYSMAYRLTALMPNSNISMGISAMLTNLRSLQMVLGSSGISLSQTRDS